MADRDFILRRRELTPTEDCLPDSVSKLFELMEEAFEVLGLDTTGTVNLGSTQPGPDDVDKPWISRNLDDQPTGLRQFYNGAWRTMGFEVGMQMRFHGPTPSVVPPWYLADGTNGTENLNGGGEQWIEYRGF